MRLACQTAAAFAFVAAFAAPALSQEPDAERGRELALRWCVSCHVVAPDEPGADVGPAFATLGGLSEAALHAWLADPHPPMPNFDLSARDIDDLAAHIRAVSHGG